MCQPWETKDSYVVQVAMPGVKPDSIGCAFEGNVLTCAAESGLQAENATAIWQSHGGRSEYRVELSSDVEADQGEARCEQTLTVTLPKVAHARARSIEVVAK